MATQREVSDSWGFVLALPVAAHVGCAEINESTKAHQFKNYDIPNQMNHNELLQAGSRRRPQHRRLASWCTGT